MESVNLILGVDAGRHGAYVILSKSGDVVYKGMFRNTERGIDFKSYVNDLKPLANRLSLAFVEEVHSIYGSSSASTFTFGRNYQTALNGLDALDIPYRLVGPKTWQKEMFKNTERLFKKDKPERLDTKAMALTTLRKFYDEKDFIPSARARKPHDGLVDAALIARYGLGKLMGVVIGG